MTIEWKSEHAEALSSLLADPDAVALLPQPFATVAKAKADTINIDLDLTKNGIPFRRIQKHLLHLSWALLLPGQIL